MTSVILYLEEAEKEMGRVETEADLLKWADRFMNQIPKAAAREIEEMYERKAAWLLGARAG